MSMTAFPSHMSRAVHLNYLPGSPEYDGESREEALKLRLNRFMRFYNGLRFPNEEATLEQFRPEIYYPPRGFLFRHAGTNLADFVGPFIAAVQWLECQFLRRGESCAREEFELLSAKEKSIVSYGYMMKYQGHAPKLLLDGGKYVALFKIKEYLGSPKSFPVEDIENETESIDKTTELSVAN